MDTFGFVLDVLSLLVIGPLADDKTTKITLTKDVIVIGAEGASWSWGLRLNEGIEECLICSPLVCFEPWVQAPMYKFLVR